jgi:ABC-type proline/glycine betaine transport system permease subunit
MVAPLVTCAGLGVEEIFTMFIFGLFAGVALCVVAIWLERTFKEARKNRDRL